MRIYKREVQEKVFEILGISSEQVNGHLNLFYSFWGCLFLVTMASILGVPHFLVFVYYGHLVFFVINWRIVWLSTIVHSYLATSGWPMIAHILCTCCTIILSMHVESHVLLF